jgi:hypothetical protein
MSRMRTAVVKFGGFGVVVVAAAVLVGCGGGTPTGGAAPGATGSAAIGGTAPGSTAGSGAVPDPGPVLAPMPTTGAGPADREQAATYRSCKLLTRDDLERALGQQYRDAEPTLDENSSVLSSVTHVNQGCTYWATERRSAGVGEVNLDVAQFPDATGTYATIRARYRDVPSAADVSGVGDAAFRSGNMLMVRKGNTIVDFGVNETADAIALARLMTVARIVLPRV